jgi:hypothetical protein
MHAEDMTASLMNRKLWRKGINLTTETPSSCFISLRGCVVEELLSDKDNQTETRGTKA